MFISFSALALVVFGFSVDGMFWRVGTINKGIIFVIELNPLQSVVKSGHQAYIGDEDKVYIYRNKSAIF